MKFIILLLSLYLLSCGGVYFWQHKLIFYPQKLKKDYKFKFNSNFEEVWWSLQDEAGVEIHGLHFLPKVSSQKAILYFHGNAGSLESWGSVAPPLAELGYHVYVIDYRTYGKSKGELSFSSFFKDAELVYKSIAQNHDEVVVYGRSVGTGIASYIAANFPVKKLILETPYDEFRTLGKHYFPWWPSFVIKYNFSNKRYVDKIKVPVLVLIGTEDEVIPYKLSLSQKVELPGNYKVVVIEGGHHNDLELFPEHMLALKEFL